MNITTCICNPRDHVEIENKEKREEFIAPSLVAYGNQVRIVCSSMRYLSSSFFVPVIVSLADGVVVYSSSSSVT
jgi:hypothetical protein